jgi:type VI secretion system secreted protein VgrG
VLHHAITAGGHARVSTGRSWLVSPKEAVKLFAHKQRMRLSSAQADIEIQALQKSLNLLSKLDISMTADRITPNATGAMVAWV